MVRKILTALLLTIVLVTSQSGVVVATDGDEHQIPTEIRNIDCPETTRVVMNESLNSTDYINCLREDRTRQLQRTLWGKVQTARGLAHWLVDEGESLQQSGLPVVPGMGHSLEEFGKDLLKKAAQWEENILSY